MTPNKKYPESSSQGKRGILMAIRKSRAGAACRQDTAFGGALTNRTALVILKSGDSYWPKSGEKLLASHRNP